MLASSRDFTGFLVTADCTNSFFKTSFTAGCRCYDFPLTIGVFAGSRDFYDFFVITSGAGDFLFTSFAACSGSNYFFLKVVTQCVNDTHFGSAAICADTCFGTVYRTGRSFDNFPFAVSMFQLRNGFGLLLSADGTGVSFLTFCAAGRLCGDNAFIPGMLTCCRNLYDFFVIASGAGQFLAASFCTSRLCDDSFDDIMTECCDRLCLFLTAGIAGVFCCTFFRTSRFFGNNFGCPVMSFRCNSFCLEDFAAGLTFYDFLTFFCTGGFFRNHCYIAVSMFSLIVVRMRRLCCRSAGIRCAVSGNDRSRIGILICLIWSSYSNVLFCYPDAVFLKVCYSILVGNCDDNTLVVSLIICICDFISQQIVAVFGCIDFGIFDGDVFDFLIIECHQRGQEVRVFRAVYDSPVVDVYRSEKLFIYINQNGLRFVPDCNIYEEDTFTAECDRIVFDGHHVIRCFLCRNPEVFVISVCNEFFFQFQFDIFHVDVFVVLVAQLIKEFFSDIQRGFRTYIEAASGCFRFSGFVFDSDGVDFIIGACVNRKRNSGCCGSCCDNERCQQRCYVLFLHGFFTPFHAHRNL